jgi:hypothetical protein
MTTICVDLPDGSLISFDRIRRQFILTLKNGSLMSCGQIPVRPNPPSVFQVGGVSVAVEAPKSVPVRKTVTCKKLGYKKAPVIHSAIWNQRFVALDHDTVTYHANEGAPAKGTICLKPGCTTRVIQSHEPARKDRYEDNDNQGAVAMMTASIASHASPYGTAIGLPNAVELHVPANLENMLGGIMGANPMSLAFGGGVKKNVTANRARTYYFSFDTLAEAEAFSSALENNIKVVTEATPGLGEGQQVNGTAARQGNFSGLNNAMNQMATAQANQSLIGNPDTSQEWYKRTLNTEVPTLVLYEKVISFYDQLAAVGVHA